MLFAIVLAALLTDAQRQEIPPPEPALQCHVRQVTEEKSDSDNPSVPRMPVARTTYDPAGRVTEESGFDPEAFPPRLRNHKLYRYDRNGYRLTITYYDEGGNPEETQRHVVRQNDAGQTVEEYDHGPTGRQNRSTFDYNAGGDCTKRTWFDGAGAMGATTSTTFDMDHHVQKNDVVNESTLGSTETQIRLRDRWTTP